MPSWQTTLKSPSTSNILMQKSQDVALGDENTATKKGTVVFKQAGYLKNESLP